MHNNYQFLQICWVWHALGLDIPNKSESLRAGTIILHQTKHRYPEHRTQQQVSCKNTLGKRWFSSSSSWCTTPWYLHSWHILYESNIIQPYSKDKQTHHLYLYMRAYMQLIWYHWATFLPINQRFPFPRSWPTGPGQRPVGSYHLTVVCWSSTLKPESFTSDDMGIMNWSM